MTMLAAGAVHAADIAPGLNDQALLDQIKIRLANFILKFFEHFKAVIGIPRVRPAGLAIAPMVNALIGSCS